MINAAVHSNEAKQLWAKPRWLPQEVGIIVDQGQFFCYEGQDLRMHLQRGVYKILVYELVGVVAEIHSGENQKPNLVSMINGEFLELLVPTDEYLLTFPQYRLRLGRKRRRITGISLTTSSFARSPKRKHSASTPLGSCRRY